MLIRHCPFTEISKYMLPYHAVIDDTICNNNAKDGMIHDIASFLITRNPVIQAHKKCF